jgi:hypothetical protein
MPKSSLERALGLAAALIVRVCFVALLLGMYGLLFRNLGLVRLDPAAGPFGNPAVGEIVLDAMQLAVLIHVPIIGRRPDGRMSRSAHLAPRSS